MDRLTAQFLQHVMPNSDPTQGEIDFAVKVIATKYPHIDPLCLADALYQKLHEMKLQEQQQREASRIPQQIPAKCFDFHNFLKRMIAKSYYYFGYGYEKFLRFMLKKHASFHIDQPMYIIFSKGMVLQVYRSLERMVIRSGCMIKLKHKNTVMKINQWILSEGESPLHDDSELLRRFIAKRYDINDTSFNSDEAKLLYDILEQKYDPFATKDVERMDECLNNIELYSNDSPQLNFDQLLNDNQQIDDTIDLNVNFTPIVNNTISSRLSNSKLHYQSCDSEQLNFDMDSADSIHL